MFHRFMALALLVATLNMACGREGETHSVVPVDSIPTAKEGIRLQGNWKSKCLDPKETGLGEVVRLGIHGDRFSREFLVSPHGDCSSPYIEGRISGRLIFVNVRVSEEGRAVDVEANSAALKPLTALAAQVMNLAKTCGFSDWRENTEKEVFERLGEEGCAERYPRTDYTLIATERNQDGHQVLLFGAGERLSHPARRPVRLDRSEQIFTPE